MPACINFVVYQNYPNMYSERKWYFFFQGQEQTDRGWRECWDKPDDCDQDHCYLKSFQTEQGRRKDYRKVSYTQHRQKISNNLEAKKSGVLCWKYSWKWEVYWPVRKKEVKRAQWWIGLRNGSDIQNWTCDKDSSQRGEIRLLCAKYQNCIQL